MYLVSVGQNFTVMPPVNVRTWAYELSDEDPQKLLRGSKPLRLLQ